VSGFDAVEIDDLGSRTPVACAKTVNLLESASMTTNGSPVRNSHRERWNRGWYQRVATK